MGTNFKSPFFFFKFPFVSWNFPNVYIFFFFFSQENNLGPIWLASTRWFDEVANVEMRMPAERFDIIVQS